MLDQAEAELGSEDGGPTRPGAAEPAVAFLAPLDPFVWERAFLRELFRFDYIWEVYVPEAKRRWGYYVLPILYGDRLVGRIEPRFERKANALRIVGLLWEEGFRPRQTDGFVDAMRDAMEAYRRFGGVERIDWAEGLQAWERLLTPRARRRSPRPSGRAERVTAPRPAASIR